MRLFLRTILAHLMVSIEGLLEHVLAVLDPDGRPFAAVTSLQHTLDVARHHELAVLAHTVCYACTDLAPGWWDWDVDCAGHDCGYCASCVGEFSPPRFEHDCHSGCHYLGRFEGERRSADLYVCLAEDFAPCYIARFSDEGSDYWSMSVSDYPGTKFDHLPAIAEAHRRHRNAVGVIRRTV